MNVKIVDKCSSPVFGRCDILSSSRKRCGKNAVYMVVVEMLNGEEEIVCVCKEHLQFLRDSEFKGIVEF